MTTEEAKEQIIKMQGLKLKPYTKALDEVLAALGITHQPDKTSDYTGRHILEKNGVLIGLFTAHETWQWLSTYLKEEPSTSVAERSRAQQSRAK